MCYFKCDFFPLEFFQQYYKGHSLFKLWGSLDILFSDVCEGAESESTFSYQSVEKTAEKQDCHSGLNPS